MSDEGLQIGRRKKAQRIARILRRLPFSAAEARTFNDDDWAKIARLCYPQHGRKPPSAETRALVIAELESDPKDEDVR